MTTSAPERPFLSAEWEGGRARAARAARAACYRAEPVLSGLSCAELVFGDGEEQCLGGGDLVALRVGRHGFDLEAAAAPRHQAGAELDLLVDRGRPAVTNRELG